MIRIYYNGIKGDDGRLVRCFYSLDNNAEHAPSVSICARDYAPLPRDLLPVVNHTDIMTDYIDNDRAYLTPEHPLYKFFRYAALKDRARMAEKCLKPLRAELSSPERWPGRHDMVRQDIATQERFIAEYNRAENPGQPA